MRSATCAASVAGAPGACICCATVLLQLYMHITRTHCTARNMCGCQHSACMRAFAPLLLLLLLCRWTKGHMQIFFSRRCPLFNWKLPLLHKLLYCNGTWA